MGTFDYVNYSAVCPECMCQLEGWQSKDGPCYMEHLEPWQVKNFYTKCGNCGAWIEANVSVDVEHIVKNLDVVLTAKS